MLKLYFFFSNKNLGLDVNFVVWLSFVVAAFGTLDLDAYTEEVEWYHFNKYGNICVISSWSHISKHLHIVLCIDTIILDAI